jgi:benzil reductase ((S)-benzoin forming)
MNYYYITGTSRGLGEALAMHFLNAAPNNKVIGISRSQSIEHKNYIHYAVDLGDPEMVRSFHFPPHHDAKRIILINNAGVIGMIKPIGKTSSGAIINNYNVNLIAPAILMNSFLETYSGSNAQKTILNVSSGAGKHPIEGWGNYCSSKAGIDMLSQVIAEEQKSVAPYPTLILSVAPGVVDTHMQEEIRSASPNDFKRLNEFINYKIENQLAHPDIVAKKYAYILDHMDKFNGVLVSVKDIPEQ